MARLRDDLSITVPTFFRCPISLEVMKSPVSLCTGFTYDRSSIQRWLDAGNNTCPVTMHLLQTKDLLPNRTLHSLIQIWSDSLHRSQPLLSSDQLLPTLSDLQTQTESLRLASLAKLRHFAQHSDHNKLLLAKTEGFVDQLLHNVTGTSVDFLQQLLVLLGLLLDTIQDRDGFRNSMLRGNKHGLDSLLLVLQQGSSESKIAAARILQFVAADAEAKLLIAEKEGVLAELLKLAAPEKDPEVIENALAALVAVSTPKRSKAKLVRLGAVRAMSRLLTEASLGAAAVEKVLKVVETASATREGRREICEEAACVAAVLSKVREVSSAATEYAITTLWIVCYLFRDRKAQEAVTQANGLNKILLLMQSNCRPHVRQMCTDLLKIFRVKFRKLDRVCKTSQRGLCCPGLFCCGPSMIRRKWIRLRWPTAEKRIENVVLPPRLRVGWQAICQPTYH